MSHSLVRSLRIIQIFGNAALRCSSLRSRSRPWKVTHGEIARRGGGERSCYVNVYFAGPASSLMYLLLSAVCISRVVNALCYLFVSGSAADSLSYGAPPPPPSTPSVPLVRVKQSCSRESEGESSTGKKTKQRDTREGGCKYTEMDAKRAGNGTGR